MGCTPASKGIGTDVRAGCRDRRGERRIRLVAWALFVLEGPALRRLLDARGRDLHERARHRCWLDGDHLATDPAVLAAQRLTSGELTSPPNSVLHAPRRNICRSRSR